MVKEQTTKLETINVGEETPQPPKSYRLHILFGLVIFVLAETILLFFLFPSPEQIARKIADLQLPKVDPDIPLPDILPDSDELKKPMAEKLLGDKFKVQSIRQGAEQITDVFTVTIVVQVLKKDETAYDKLYVEHQYAIRDAVEVVLRASSFEDRNQDRLTAIRRNVKKAINDVLGISYVQGVLCIDSLVEMI
ncbi:MAG: hypothetical protein LBU34_13385 [Planctomycetaceae bacterium]|jgi:hypothetical protein|nr:hypothetical protein [Planctomycetaceae bacterium]